MLRLSQVLRLKCSFGEIINSCHAFVSLTLSFEVSPTCYPLFQFFRQLPVAATLAKFSMGEVWDALFMLPSPPFPPLFLFFSAVAQPFYLTVPCRCDPRGIFSKDRLGALRAVQTCNRYPMAAHRCFLLRDAPLLLPLLRIYERAHGQSL